jgi:hypothetical protein
MSPIKIDQFLKFKKDRSPVKIYHFLEKKKKADHREKNTIFYKKRVGHL